MFFDIIAIAIVDRFSEENRLLEKLYKKNIFSCAGRNCTLNGIMTHLSSCPCVQSLVLGVPTMFRSFLSCKPVEMHFGDKGLFFVYIKYYGNSVSPIGEEEKEEEKEEWFALDSEGYQ